MLKMILVLASMALPISTVLADENAIESEPEWTLRQPLALPRLASDVPANTAGCVVVGHHVRANGSSADARVLKGAFTGGVDEAMQQAFAKSVLEAAADWRFQAADPDRKEAGFRMQTIGFIPTQDTANRVVAGVEALPEPLRDVCQIKDLAAWGEANAVSVEQARAEHGGQVVVPDPATGALYWVRKGSVQPPVFPPDAIKAGVEACVVVGAVIGIDGRVKNLTVLKSDVRGAGRRTWAGRGLDQKDAAELMGNSVLAFVTAMQFAPGPDNLERNAAFEQWPITYELGSPQGMDCESLSADEVAKMLKG